MRAREFSLATGVPGRTTRRWFAAWHRLGVAGVRLVKAAGRRGERFEVDPELPERWRRGELPDPRGVELAAA